MITHNNFSSFIVPNHMPEQWNSKPGHEDPVCVCVSITRNWMVIRFVKFLLHLVKIPQNAFHKTGHLTLKLIGETCRVLHIHEECV